jgi:hypothetical protein
MSNQPIWSLPGTLGAMGAGDADNRHGRVQQGYLHWKRRRHVKAERSIRAINQHHKLCAFAPLGLVDFGLPFLAGTKVPNMTVHGSRLAKWLNFQVRSFTISDGRQSGIWCEQGLPNG